MELAMAFSVAPFIPGGNLRPRKSEASSNPWEERQMMMRDHMQSMQSMMNMMHGMMAGQSNKHGAERMAMDDRAQCSGMNKRHGMMQQRVTNLEERLNAMQLLVDQMLKSQSTMLDGG